VKFLGNTNDKQHAKPCMVPGHWHMLVMQCYRDGFDTPTWRQRSSFTTAHTAAAVQPHT